jgi:hypothetical protein
MQAEQERHRAEVFFGRFSEDFALGRMISVRGTSNMAVHTGPRQAAEKLLAAVKQLSATELRVFEQRFAAWRGRNGSNGNAASSDRALVTSIRQNSTLPPAHQRRLELLRRKRQAERLNNNEEKELQALWQRVEQMNVARLLALTELARRRGTDVRKVMRELDLPENLYVF